MLKARPHRQIVRHDEALVIPCPPDQPGDDRLRMRRRTIRIDGVHRHVPDYQPRIGGRQNVAKRTPIGRLQLADRSDPIVLDIGMPEFDGLDVCRKVRKSSDLPILFRSPRDDEIDRVLGLEIGGDDYVTRPFSPSELVARVNVILRRSRRDRSCRSRVRLRKDTSPSIPSSISRHSAARRFT
jgi:CheY-like chemotaxis protein